MNIYQKLIEVRKSVPYLKKDNKGYQFSYVSSSQTLGSLREAMDKYNLLLIPSVKAYEVRDHETSKGGHNYFTIMEMLFVWVNADNPEERIECPWTGQGLDDGEKGVGKALTYAEKYFLLKFFNIATDKDDPDSFQEKKTTEKPKEIKPIKPIVKEEKPPSEQKFSNPMSGAMTDPQRKKIYAMLKGAGLNDIQMRLVTEQNHVHRDQNPTKADANHFIDNFDTLIAEYRAEGTPF